MKIFKKEICGFGLKRKSIGLENNLFSGKERREKKCSKRLLLVGGLFLILFLVCFLGLFLPGLDVFNKTKELESKVNETKSVFGSKDFSQIKLKVGELENQINDLERNYQKMILMKLLPGVRQYYFDGEKMIVSAKSGVKVLGILIEAVEPYRDFLGFKGSGETAFEKTAEITTEERVNFLINSVEGIVPKLGEVENELRIIEEKISTIDSSRYPKKLGNYQIRENIEKIKEYSLQAITFFREGKPMLEKIGWLLGKDKPRNYLFLFQNDGELRPTGGFWTAYGILKVDKGKVSPLVSEDIYALDSRFASTIPAPRPIKAYHKNVYYLNLRDINLSPDFEVSVKDFIEKYKTIKGSYDFDGVVAVDTKLLVDILSVLGRVGVPGWGNFGPEPDNRCWGCPQVVYQLELLADKPLPTERTERKGFLAPLMHSILANILGSPKEKVGLLASVFWKNVVGKHILFYFPDDNLQKAAISLGIAGKIEETEGDYFHLNDANFAGAKSNLFIEQTVKQEINKKDGKIYKKVTVEYKNSAPSSDCNLERGGLCLNGLYRNWFRFYVPLGSKLIKMTGSEVEPVVYEELGKTVFEGFYGNKYPLYPESVARVTLEYELPEKIDVDHYSLYIQKQGGTKDNNYQIFLNGREEKKFLLDGDKKIGFSF